ncbi:MAG: helix-turn-helix domain-containing protein [[Clostridium] innocuum]
MEMTLGGRIQTLRKQRGITQEELAKAMQVSTQAVSKCTKGAQSGNAVEHRMPCCYRGWQIISMFQLIICLEEENTKISIYHTKPFIYRVLRLC